jgi:hypothetical protein
MGEPHRQRAGLIAQLANPDPYSESVPINHLVRVEGTPLHDRFHGESALDPLGFVRTIAVARVTMPKAMVRLSAGRREMTDDVQALCFLADANSIFYGDKLLTTGNPDVEADRALFAKLGLAAMRRRRFTSIQWAPPRCCLCFMASRCAAGGCVRSRRRARRRTECIRRNARRGARGISRMPAEPRFPVPDPRDVDPRAFAEFRRTLKVGGLLIFTTFGPDTLKGLSAAFACADGHTHVNRFVDMQTRREVQLPVSFEVVYGHAWKGEPTAEGLPIVKLQRRPPQ